MQDIPVRAFAVSVIVLSGSGLDTRILLLNRAEDYTHGAWCQVAGGLVEAETAWQAALRELYTVTGLVPDHFYSADICEQFYEVERNCISMLPVFVAFVPEEARLQLNDAYTDAHWFTLQDALRVLHFPGQRNVLRYVWREFVESKPLDLLRIQTNV